jgi:hypothetical protein
MKTLKALALMIFGAVCFGQDTTILARMGMRNAATYHYFEAFQTYKGKWIYLDVGEIDFAKNGYWETFLGGGLVICDLKHLTLIHEAFIDRAQGRLSQSATYYQPWTLVGYRISQKVIGEAVYFTYLPLNKPARIQHVVEHIKLEYDFKHFKLGGGYGGYQYGEENWQHKPFATWTLKTSPLGELELWLQRIPRSSILGNNARGSFVQAQIRITKTFKKG